MSNCCSTSCETKTQAYPNKHLCPVNGKKFGLVSPTTIKHHIKAPWSWQKKDQGYYFCSDPDCPVVYFGQDNSVIEKSAIRTSVGLKDKSDDALVCYCFGVTKADAINNPLTREFVLNETKLKQCTCKTKNPSGKCCLSEFPKN